MASIFQLNPDNNKFVIPTCNEIARIAGFSFNEETDFNINLCYQIKECGFNAIASSINLTYIERSLRNCDEAGLTMLLYNADLMDSAGRKSLVNYYKDYSALGGWLLNYDPSNPDFYDYSRLLESYNEIKLTDSKNPIYIALAAEWESKTIDSFPDYIAKFQTDFKPFFWPYAFFPNIFWPGNLSQHNQRLLIFFKNLQYFAYIARYTARPFWVYCRCQGAQEIQGGTALTPSESNMRGIIFSSLAYGAQGIYYWNYKQVSDDKYFGAPIDKTNQKTSTWDMVQRLNHEIMAYNYVFFNCEMIECRHSYQSMLKTKSILNTDGIKKFENPIGPLESISHNQISAPGILISHLFKAGKDYLVIVADPNLTANLPITLYFNNYYKVYQDFGNYEESLIDNYTYSTALNVGDYLVFRWE